MLQVDEVVGLKVGLDRLRTVKAGLLNGEPFGMGYLDDTVKDRVTELLIVRARLQREYDY